MSSSSALSGPSKEHITLDVQYVHTLSSEQNLTLQPAAFNALPQDN